MDIEDCYCSKLPYSGLPRVCEAGALSSLYSHTAWDVSLARVRATVSSIWCCLGLRRDHTHHCVKCSFSGQFSQQYFTPSFPFYSPTDNFFPHPPNSQTFSFTFLNSKI